MGRLSRDKSKARSKAQDTTARKTARRRPARRRPAMVALQFLVVVALAGGVLYAPLYLWRSGLIAEGAGELAAAATRASAEAGLRVDEILVEGRQHTSRDHLRIALEVDRGAAILDLDLERLRQRVEALPWVRRAVVERHLPDTLLVALEERRPRARWQHQGRIALVDETGAEIVVDDLDRFAALPLVVGAGANERVDDLAALLAPRPALAGRVVAATWVGARRWSLHLDNGLELRLPEQDPEAALARLARLEAEHGLLDRSVEAIDLRWPDRLIVRLPEGGARRVDGPVAGQET